MVICKMIKCMVQKPHSLTELVKNTYLNAKNTKLKINNNLDKNTTSIMIPVRTKMLESIFW